MQSKQIKEWVKANKLLSAIIVGAIIVAIILYLGVAKQAPETKEQPEEAAETPGGEAVEAPTEEVAAPETVPEEVPQAETVEEPTKTPETSEELPPVEPVETGETTEGGTA